MKHAGKLIRFTTFGELYSLDPVVTLCILCGNVKLLLALVQIVELRVESISKLPKEDGEVALVENVISLKSGSLLTIHEK